MTNASTVILQVPPLTITTDAAIDEEERDPWSTRMTMIAGKKVVEDKGRDLLLPFDIATVVDEIMTMKIAIDDDADDIWDLNRHPRDVLEDGGEGVHMHMHEDGRLQVVALRLIPRDLLLL